jgi:hypothetical protein
MRPNKVGTTSFAVDQHGKRRILSAVSSASLHGVPSYLIELGIFKGGVISWIEALGKEGRFQRVNFETQKLQKRIMLSFQPIVYRNHHFSWLFTKLIALNIGWQTVWMMVRTSSTFSVEFCTSPSFL